MTKCVTCGAVYSPTLPDGLRYFHACPSLSDAEVIAALAINVDPTKWSAADKAAFAAASRVRPNARNENAPATAAQQAIVAQTYKPADPASWTKVNAALDAAIVANGGGTTIVP